MKVQGITVHGFRSAFRDWASEQPNVTREIAELSLTHTVSSEVERAYEYLDYQLAAKFHFHQEIHLSQHEGLF